MVRLVILIAVLGASTSLLAAEGDRFAKGAFTLDAYAAYADDVEASDYHMPAVAVGANWYAFDDVSFGLELGGVGFYGGAGQDATAVNLSGVFRVHFIDTPKYTLYFDALFGPTYASEQVPGGGTHFNFLSRFGVGGTVPLRDNVDLMAGARFFHLSNANIHGEDQNPAINGVQYYVGLMWKF
jgi:hypothetical protein